MAKYTSIGGQALIEGIMMKSPEKTAMAVRKPDGEIDLSYIEEKSLRDKYKIFKAPVLRGVVAFIESMVGGYKAMMRSADISGFTDLSDNKKPEKKKPTAEEELLMSPEEIALQISKEVLGETEPEEAPEEPPADAAPKEEKISGGLMAVITVLGTVLGFGIAIVLFMLIPRLSVSGLQMLFGNTFSRVARSAIEQLIKIIVLVVYMWAVSLLSDIKRVFMYHGAEHKTIFCYEHGRELTVANVRTERRFHPRCGTSFMILMILVSFAVSIIIQLIFKNVYNNALLWVLIKILMVPFVCGIGYELLRVCGKFDNIITKIISAPGMWLQRITTKEPEDDMIEIAIAALKACEPAVPDVDRPQLKEEENEQNNI